MAKYTVVKGDSLGNIADKKRGKIEREKYKKLLRDANPTISYPNGWEGIDPGDKINLPNTKNIVKNNVGNNSGRQVFVEVKNKCTCCIKNNSLIAKNIIYKKSGSALTNSYPVKKIKAIVLHRTAGGTTAGGIRASKGAHFYVDGPKGVDGEIFQTMSLSKRTKHIKKLKIYKGRVGRISRLDIQNYNSVGIEVVGYAYFKKNNILYKDISGYPKVLNKIPLSKLYTNNNGQRYWDPLSEKQIKSVVCIIKGLMKKYSISKSDIVVHELIQEKTSGEGQCVMDAIISKI
jgi:N-acetyl-anhydromuramyl-L-alanine amidase AmpD